MFSHAVKLFAINRFDIRVDPSWLIIAALVTWSLSQHYFPSVLPGATPTVYLQMGALAMLGLFVSLLIHELAHSIVARKLGVPIRSITLFVFGGVAELDSEPTSASVEFRVAIAGPVMSLVLAAGFWILALIAARVAAPAPVTEVLSYLGLVNLVLALFNLVPAFPLDGGRMLRAYLWHRSGDALSATRVAAQSGSAVAFVLMAFGILALFQGALLGGLWYLLIGGFVLVAARASLVSQIARAAFDGKTVRTLMKHAPITADPDMTLAAFVNQVLLPHGISFVPVVEGHLLLGHMDQSVLSSIDRENWANTRVGDVFVGLDAQVMIDPDLPIQDLFEIVARTDRRKFMVVRDHQLHGVITLSDLTRYLSRAMR